MSRQLEAEWHKDNKGNFSDYSNGSKYKAKWICSSDSRHIWEARVSHRVAGSKCPYCTNKLLMTGYNDLQTRFPEILKELSPKNNLDPTQIVYGSAKVLSWECELGHEWETSLSNRTVLGRGCPYCKSKRPIPGRTDLATIKPDLAKEWSKKNLVGPESFLPQSNKKVWWECQLGHQWEAAINKRYDGTGCPYCTNQRVLLGFNDLLTTHGDKDFMKEWSGSNIVKQTEITYDSEEPIIWECKNGHTWTTRVSERNRGFGCPNCGRNTSKGEEQLAEFLTKNNIEFIRNSKDVISPYELDIYIPEKNIAIEFNGIYWHLESNGKDKNYHYKKWELCQQQGIQLIQIWEDDWISKQTIVKKALSQKIGFGGLQKIAARKTQVVEVSVKQSKDFMRVNHIQGWASGSYYVGLEYEGELVALGIFKKEPNTQGKTLNIIRFATSHQVIGGFTKILAWVEKKYTPQRFITFSDNMISDGGLYSKNDFIKSHEIPPDYYYYHNGVRQHKFNYRKARFKADPNLKYDEDKTESQLAEMNNIKRLWDAGKIAWVKDVKTVTLSL